MTINIYTLMQAAANVKWGKRSFGEATMPYDTSQLAEAACELPAVSDLHLPVLTMTTKLSPKQILLRYSHV
jgi:hypothetical protein